MEEFIYSVKGIFTDLLDNNSAKKYYIAPYQRGYPKIRNYHPIHD